MCFPWQLIERSDEAAIEPIAELVPPVNPADLEIWDEEYRWDNGNPVPEAPPVEENNVEEQLVVDEEYFEEYYEEPGDSEDEFENRLRFYPTWDTTDELIDNINTTIIGLLNEKKEINKDILDEYLQRVVKPACDTSEKLAGDASFIDEEEDNAVPSVSDSSSDDECESDEGVIDFKSMDITNCLKYFALSTNQKHSVMNMLLSILNMKTNFVLPKDARTLLSTNSRNRRPELSALGNGTFWTRGIKKSLMDNLRFSIVTETISLNICIDGLPLHKSSNMQFWPIMINIHEMPLIAPITTALYCGRTKPTNAQQFMDLLVKELNKLMDEGLELNSRRAQVIIRAIIADSPARAFLKDNSLNYN
ncbi:uncharacterized protein LOC128309208 [Anopheles moucheti]|uniref:uncharacterized protein LOC128309208 n=1 Tax=Anopheles moucheti TaxID=186751 RepID=UPI0022F126C0|nr:uncharacterized protein LOC128309208 [Anopheles moucheti]